MKKLLVFLLIMVLATFFGFSQTKTGFKVHGNKVIFMYNPKDYPAGFDEIGMVTVAGEFNNWNPGAKDWQAKLNTRDGIWYFESTIDLAQPGMQFKFVVNGKDWQQPDPSKISRKNLADDGYGGFNLKLVYESIYSVVGQKTSNTGYIILEDNVIFTFNPKDYPAGFDGIGMVTVAGQFNDWNPGAKDWLMTRNKNGIWYFVSTKSKIVNGAQFKFVVNGKDWQQPDSFKVPRKNLADDGYGGFNLKVLY